MAFLLIAPITVGASEESNVPSVAEPTDSAESFTAAQGDTQSAQACKTFSPRFFATYDWGKEASMPCWPEGRSSGYGLGGAPVNGYGFGIEADYRPMRDMAFTFDIGFHSWRFMVGEQGSRSTSMWVFEQTDYSSYYTGTFDSDAYFYMTATMMKLGFRYYFPVNETMQPWTAIS